MFNNLSKFKRKINRLSVLNFLNKFLQLALLSAFLFPANALAADLNSTNFTIFDNGLNSGGGRTTSTNFILESTIGEFSGDTTSTNFSNRSGFQAIEAEPKLTMALSTNSVALGILSSGSISSGSVTVVVTTNARSGYSVKLSEDANLHSGSNDINDVLDGTVSAGHEEYGISTSGSAGQLNSSDTAISGTVTVASNSTFASAEQTVVTFEASIDSATVNGSYSHTVTFTAVANF